MRVGPFFASEIRKASSQRMRGHWNWNWNWHLDEVFVNINSETDYIWSAVENETKISRRSLPSFETATQ